MKVVQIGTNKGFDHLSNYLLSNYEKLEFGLFVEPNQLHIESIQKCYEKYSNIIVENIAIKSPLHDQEKLKIYYHTNDYPEYQLASCNIEHIKNHLWCPHLWRDGEGKIENFEVSCLTLEQLFDKYQIQELDLLCLDIEGIDAEILLTFDWKKYKIKKVEFEHLHLGLYKEALYNMMLGMKYSQVSSLHEYDWAFENKNIIFTDEKLKNFPSVNFISIEESQDRRDLLYKNFEKFGISNITPHIYKKYNDDDHNIAEGSIILLSTGRGPVTSHLKAIKEWYENTDEEYTFFCEDDLSFESLEYWNFTWEEFFNNLPNDWDCVQLCIVKDDMFQYNYPETNFKIKHRCFDDWSGCAYLIHRRHAKNLIDNYYPSDFIHLEYKGTDREYRVGLSDAYWFLLPHIENLIYSSFNDRKVYNFPLFLENVIDFQSTWQDANTNFINVSSYHQTLDWWKTKGKNFTLQELSLKLD